jgi:hypothetical protein
MIFKERNDTYYFCLDVGLKSRAEREEVLRTNEEKQKRRGRSRRGRRRRRSKKNQ